MRWWRQRTARCITQNNWGEIASLQRLPNVNFQPASERYPLFMSSSPATSTVPGKIVARAASIHIDNGCNAFMHDCFRQFGIHVLPLAGETATMFNRQKFEA